MKTIEVQLSEATARVTVLETENKALKTQVEESQKVAASAELGKLLGEAKLPSVAADRLKKQFEGATKTEGMKEAVEAEGAYVKSLGGAVKKNNGSADNQGGGSQESDAAAQKARLIESIKKNFKVGDKEAALMAE